jgi:hypothetical protein
MLESVSSLPRLQNEIMRLEDSLKDVESDMKSLSLQLREFDEKHSSGENNSLSFYCSIHRITGFEELTVLDGLKSNMERCRAILQEHDCWALTSSEAQQAMDTVGGKLSDSADR